MIAPERAKLGAQRPAKRALRLVIATTLLLLVPACDWRGAEHERKVKAEHAGAAKSATAEEQDAFDKLCLRDASTCWQELVQAAHRATLGPAPGTTGITQVCCEVPKTDVSQDHSTPSGFTAAVGSGTLTIFVASLAPARKVVNNATVRGLPAHALIPTAVGQRLTLSWLEDGLTYFVSTSDGVTEAQAQAFLAQLTVHRPR